MTPRVLGTAALAALGCALVVAFSGHPVPTLLGTILKALALLAMLVTIFLAINAPAQRGHRGPVLRTVVTVIVTIAVAVLGSFAWNWAGVAIWFMMAWTLACLGGAVVRIGWLWWDDPARKGGWAVAACGGVGMICALTPIGGVGASLAGLVGGVVMLGVGLVSSWRARW